MKMFTDVYAVLTVVQNNRRTSCLHSDATRYENVCIALHILHSSTASVQTGCANEETQCWNARTCCTD